MSELPPPEESPEPEPRSPSLFAPTSLKGRRVALGILLLLALGAIGFIASPLWVGLMLGTVMAFSVQPMYRWITYHTGERRVFAALVTTATGTVALIGGGALAVYVLLNEVVSAAEGVELDLDAPGGNSLERLLSLGSRLLGMEEAALLGWLRAELGQASTTLAQGAGSILVGVTDVGLSLFISIWTMYYVLLNWPALAVRLERTLPLDPRHTRALIIEFRDVGRSAFVGTVVTALAQGALGAIGFGLAGMGRPLALGLITAIASFLPVVGTSFVFIPIAIYLMATGQIGKGVFVLIWGFVVIVGFADYVLRPRLVGSKSVTDPLLMLVSLLGGLETLGVSGLIVGPMLMSLFLAIARIYEKEVSGEDLTHDKILELYRRI